MATTTPNFGWSVPTSTDLVKDGATAIETLGDSIDASLVDLKGGTTGQVLAKNSNTDMDFTWTTDATGIPASAFTAKGVILVGTGSSTYTAQTVGTNGQVLTANSAQADGVEWATVSAGGLTLISSTALSGSSTSITSIPSTYKSLLAVIYNINSGSTTKFTFRVNSDSGSNYFVGSYATEALFPRGWQFAAANANYGMVQIEIPAYTLTQGKIFNFTVGMGAAGGDAYAETYATGYRGTSAISSIQIGSGSGGGSFSSGTVLLYGVN